MLRISYTKRDGAWAVKIEGSNAERGKLREGDRILVAKRDGSFSPCVLGQAVDVQRDYTIALIATPRAARPAARSGWRDRTTISATAINRRKYGRRLNPADGAEYYSSGQYDEDS